MSIRIIGTHSGHDASACLLIDDALVGAISKERLTRSKHDGGDPSICVDYLLESFGLSASDIDLAVHSAWHDAPTQLLHADSRFARSETTFQHHLLHGYAASVMTRGRPSIVLITDGRGCRPEDNGETGQDAGLYEVESVYLHERGELHELEKRYRPYFKNRYRWGSHIDSLGYAYAAVSKKIFGSTHAAGKVMALAAFSEQGAVIPNPYNYDAHRTFSVNPEWLAFLERCPDSIPWQTPLAADLASSVQRGLEDYLHVRSEYLSAKYACGDFLLGGGVALNCKSNGLLANCSWMRSIDIFPACGDEGLAVGAAVWALRTRFGIDTPINCGVSLGAPYPVARETTDAPARIAHLLAEGKIVGVHHGGSEFGPRALGYRSILSPANDLAFKIRLNMQIKRREPFRPFGGIVLRRNLHELTRDVLAGPNMLSAAKIIDGARAAYPALAHVDHSVRLQVVEDDGGLLHGVLDEYERVTGRIALINTSFNGADEPIVETPSQAARCAAAIGLDYVYVGGSLEKIHG